MKFFKTMLLILIAAGLLFTGWRLLHSGGQKHPARTVAELPESVRPDVAVSVEAPPPVAEIETVAPVSLITGGSETDIPWTSRTPAAKRVRKIVPDPAWMTPEPSLKSGDCVELALFDDTIFRARVSNVTRYPNGAVGMTAHLEGGTEGTVFLSCCDGQMRASVEVPGGSDYYVRYNPETGAHYAIEVDREKTIVRECGGDVMVPPPNDARADAPAPGPASEPVAPADAPAGSTVIDVMIVYTPQALADEGGLSGMNNNIAIAMQRANEAHTNSNTQIYLNLVHSAQTTYTESGNDNTDLSRLTNTNDGYMDEVHTLRDTYGADFVCLFSHTATVGGIGWLLSSSGGDSAHAFCLAWSGQTDTGYTAVHEWGHNMGCSHSKTQTVQPWTSSDFRTYSAGWQWADTKSSRGGYCTVMTYEDMNDDGTADHIRVGYFSNPSINYTGNSTNPTGDSNDGDNARTIREMKAVYVAYRTAPAIIVMEETNIVLTASVGGTNALSRVISNAGSGELNFSLSDDNVAGVYTWKDSDSFGGPVYEWIDISTNGTAVSLADDAESPMINLGFSFPFYGNTYNQFQVADNGVVSLTAGDVSNANRGLPSTAAPSHAFCLFWDDLNHSIAGAVCRYHSTSNRLVVSCTDVPLIGTSNKETFQLVLYPDGRIVYQYKTLNGNVSSCTVGLMDDHSTGPAIQVVYNASYLKNNLAIEFRSPKPRWISYSVTNGTVKAGGSASVWVAADAKALAEGDYYATLTVTHNDFSRSAIKIPVAFHVSGSSLPDTDSDGLPNDWETQYFGGPTNANPSALAANGINTVMDCYIAGLNPTNPSSLFLTSLLWRPPAGAVLRWSAVSGRVYSVYWTTNLPNSFQPLATNLAFPRSSYTDAVYNARRFYKIGVRLAP